MTTLQFELQYLVSTKREKCLGFHQTVRQTCITSKQFLWSDVLGINSTLFKTDTFGIGTLCPSYRESPKRNKKRRGPSLDACFMEVFVKSEVTVLPFRFLQSRHQNEAARRCQGWITNALVNLGSSTRRLCVSIANWFGILTCYVYINYSFLFFICGPAQCTPLSYQ